MLTSHCQDLNTGDSDNIIINSCLASHMGQNNHTRHTICSNKHGLEDSCTDIKICTSTIQIQTTGNLSLDCDHQSTKVACSLTGINIQQVVNNKCFYCAFQVSCENKSEKLSLDSGPFMAIFLTLSVTIMFILLLFIARLYVKSKQAVRQQEMVCGWEYSNYSNGSSPSLNPSTYNKFLYRPQSTSFVTIERINNSCTAAIQGSHGLTSHKQTSTHDRINELRRSLSVR